MEPREAEIAREAIANTVRVIADLTDVLNSISEQNAIAISSLIEGE
jgi:hypothetical protein